MTAKMNHLGTAPLQICDKEETIARFIIHGEEIIEKQVKASGNSGRIYLPWSWVGHEVKIIRID